MNTTVHLQLRQQQSLVMTPQMQQAMKLLQMPAIELSAYLQEMIETNPFLEMETNDVSLHASSGTGEGEDPQNQWQCYWGEQQRPVAPKEGKMVDLLGNHAKALDLKTYLRQQIDQHHWHPPEYDIALFLLDLLEEDGYLRASIEEGVPEKGWKKQQITRVLTRLQSLDPVGVFARDLGECLGLQLKEMGEGSKTSFVVLEHLPELMDLGPAAFSRRYKIPQDSLKDILAQLRKLNPKPGFAYGEEMDPTPLVPDVIIRRNRFGEWDCLLNEANLPRLAIDHQSYLWVMHNTTNQISADQRQYMNTQISTANWLLKSLRQRSVTILNVSKYILEVQQEYFNEGAFSLRPLTLAQVAKSLGIHESTVSRAVTGKYAATPYGIKELKFFFGNGIKSHGILRKDASKGEYYGAFSAEDISCKAAKDMIRQFIEAEDKKKPISDEGLVKLLTAKGLKVARRTVTKYRESMGIPGSFERKKASRIFTFS